MMYRIALKMLVGDTAKYIGMILAVSFSTLIITQQMAIFIGLMRRTYSFISDTPQARIWVMNPSVNFVDDISNVREIELFRVRSIEGIEWAMPFYKGLIQAKMPNGQFQTCNLLGIDAATFIGAPHTMVEGRIEDLRMPYSIIVDEEATYDKLSQKQGDGQPNRPLRIGDQLELNDRRARVVGICRVTKTFQSNPVVYTTYKNAIFYIPFQRKELSLIVATPKPGYSEQELCNRIQEVTNLKALTKDQFENLTVNYYLEHTGIPINFGIAVLLGLLVGIAITGQIFFNFTTDNLIYLALFNVLGASRRTLAMITLMQALWVALIGWGLGTGMACILGYCTEGTELAFFLAWELMLGVGLIMVLICLGSALLSVSRIFSLDLGVMFRQ
jgi:putative ABC transport system permease protein